MVLVVSDEVDADVNPEFKQIRLVKNLLVPPMYRTSQYNWVIYKFTRGTSKSEANLVLTTASLQSCDQEICTRYLSINSPNLLPLSE